MRVTRRRAIGVIAGLAAIATAWAPAFVARSHTTPAQPIDFVSRPDKGWRFLYDSIRLSRHAKLGSDAPALQRAQQIWPRVDDVELVYLVEPVTVPVAAGGLDAPPTARLARPRSRLTWFVHGRMGARPRQIVGLLDFASGRIVWDLRRVTRGRG